MISRKKTVVSPFDPPKIIHDTYVQYNSTRNLDRSPLQKDKIARFPAKILILTNNRDGGKMAACERSEDLVCKKERNARGGLIDDVREERKGCALSTRARALVFRN